jgi:hypothetical protein
MKQLIKRLLREAVGVPSNIEKAAENLYNDLIDKLKSYGEVQVGDDGTDIPFRFKNKDGRYSFSDFNPNSITIDLNVRFYESDTHTGPIIFGMGHLSKSEYSNKLKIVSIPTKDIDLQVSYGQPTSDDEVTTEKIIRTLEKDKKETISSLAHELKHAYDTEKKPEMGIGPRMKYQAYSNLRGQIIPMNKFFYQMYFIHNIENLVRPVEVYSEMIQSGVKTKEEFLNFFSNQKVLSTLREIANSNLDTLINELSQNEQQLDRFLTHFNKNPENLDLEQKVIETLVIYYQVIKENLIDSYKDAAMRAGRDKIDPVRFFFDMMMGQVSISDEHVKTIKKLSKEIEKFDNNPLDFYDYEMNKAQTVAKTMIKKLSKLFSLIEPEKSVKTEIFDPMNFEMDQLRQKIKRK